MAKIEIEIRSRRDWIGCDWVEDDSSSDDDSDIEIGGGPSRADSSAKIPAPRILKMLDYACGTGFMTRSLFPYISQSIGIDLSENMVSQFNTTAFNQGLSASEMKAYCGNLIAPATAPAAVISTADFQDFDLAVVGLGFHHFEDVQFAADRLVERLRVGGVFFIVDFMPHGNFFGGHGHAHGHGHGHGHGHEHGQECEHEHEHTQDQEHRSHGAAVTPHQTEAAESQVSSRAEDKARSAEHTVKHLGFSEETIRSIFSAAGAGKDFCFTVLSKNAISFACSGEGAKGEKMTRQVFMARGTKA